MDRSNDKLIRLLTLLKEDNPSVRDMTSSLMTIFCMANALNQIPVALFEKMVHKMVEIYPATLRGLREQNKDG